MIHMRKTKITNRKVLKSKMAEALNDEIKTLPADLKEILVDDLVTAFQNRVKVVREASSDLEYYVELGVTVTQ
jgi:hypothetical protein